MLYQLTQELERLDSLIDDYASSHEGEITEEMVRAFDLIRGDFETQIEGVADLIRKKKDEAEMFKSRAKQFADYSKRLEDMAARLKETVKDGMTVIGAKKLGPFSVCNNSSVPLEIDGDVPEEFLQYKPSPDKAKIKEALDAGEHLQFAQYGERGTHLRQKV